MPRDNSNSNKDNRPTIKHDNIRNDVEIGSFEKRAENNVLDPIRLSTSETGEDKPRK